MKPKMTHLAFILFFISSCTNKTWLQQRGNYEKLNYILFNAPEMERMPPTRFLSPSQKSAIRSYLNRELGITPRGR
jgi:hypothetical protein